VNHHKLEGFITPPSFGSFQVVTFMPIKVSSPHPWDKLSSIEISTVATALHNAYSRIWVKAISLQEPAK